MSIAFVSLASLGDCVNSTLMFEPIREAYPDHPIEVHTTTLYQSAYDNNPHVNKIIAYQARSKSECFDLYNTIPNVVKTLPYYKTLVPAPILLPTKRNSLRHPEFGENLITTFMRVLEDEGIPYRWPVETTLRLHQLEIDAVNNWLASTHTKPGARRSILMETHGESGQSFWNHHWTLAVGRHLLNDGQTNLFLNRRELTPDIAQLEKEHRGRARWCGHLTVRECSELFNHCQIFFSISSGLANACNTKGRRRDVTWIETVNSKEVNTSPVYSEGRTYWYSNDITAFIEMLKSRHI